MFLSSADLDKRGAYRRERRRELEVAGLHPPRIRLPQGQNRWLLSEIMAWETAAAAGADADRLRLLVAALVAKRQAAASALAESANLRICPDDVP